MAEEGPTDKLRDAYSVVANEIRLDILQTLWEMYTDDPTLEPNPVPFSTLKDHVGVRDSGRFHYHLNELVPRFVTHHEEGYKLAYPGARIIGAAVSGVYTDTQMSFGTPVGICPNSICKGELELGYEEGHVFVKCDTCDMRNTTYVPPILVGAHSVEQNPGLLGTFTMMRLQKAVRGFCSLCSGPVEGSVAQSVLESEREAGQTVKILYECQECGAPYHIPATLAVLDHPAVVSLLHNEGIDYREISPWCTKQTLKSEERVSNDDPVRVEVTVSVTDTVLSFTLGEDLSVLTYAEE